MYVPPVLLLLIVSDCLYVLMSGHAVTLFGLHKCECVCWQVILGNKALVVCSETMGCKWEGRCVSVWLGRLNGTIQKTPNLQPSFLSIVISPSLCCPIQPKTEGERCLDGREEWGLGSTRVDRMGTERSKNSLCMGCFTYLGFILYFGCCWKYVVLMDGNRCTPVYVLGPFLFHLYLVRNKRL